MKFFKWVCAFMRRQTLCQIAIVCFVLVICLTDSDLVGRHFWQYQFEFEYASANFCGRRTCSGSHANYLFNVFSSIVQSQRRNRKFKSLENIECVQNGCYQLIKQNE